MASLPIELSNVGATVLHIEHGRTTGTSAFSLGDSETTTELAPGETTTWTVDFSTANPEDFGALCGATTPCAERLRHR